MSAAADPELSRSRDDWWTWRWDTTTAHDVRMPFETIKRWRRGSLLTIYKFVTKSHTEWWLYGPFNLAIGFSIPRREHEQA